MIYAILNAFLNGLALDTAPILLLSFSDRSRGVGREGGSAGLLVERLPHPRELAECSRAGLLPPSRMGSRQVHALHQGRYMGDLFTCILTLWIYKYSCLYIDILLCSRHLYRS